MASTDTPSVFNGCTNTTNGTTGIVPAPVAGQTNAFLRGDGLWASPALNGFVAGPNASTDGTVAVFAGVAGNVIRDTGVSIDMSNNMSGIALLTVTSANITTNFTFGAGTGALMAAAGVVSTGTLPIADGGTGQTSKTAAFDGLSPNTTKGDITVFNGTNNVRLPVGSDGQVLQAASGQATGVQWVTNPAGAYDTIDNAGVPLTQRQVLNFSGSGITAVDNAGATRTDVSLASNLVDIAGLTPTSNTILYANGTHIANASTLMTNVYYVAKNGNDATGDGSENFPYLTIGAACTAIGNAANNAAFVDATKRYYIINIGPGVYTEAVTVPNRPFVLFNLNACQINGNVTQNFDGTLFGGALTTAKVIFQGHDLIGLHTGLSEAVNDITGNVTINRTAGAFNFNALQFINTGVSGNVIADGAVAYTLLLYMSDTNVGGNITANQATININLYAQNANTPGTTGIGGATGPGTVTLRNLRNIAFNGSVTTGAASAAFNWDNVTFTSGTFTGLTSNIVTDSASYQNYLTNVASKGSETFTFRDSAKGINSQYVPTNYTATTTQVAGALQGIDTALGTVKTTWNVTAAVSATLAKSNGYLSNNAGLVTYTLPAAAAVGDTFEISALSAGLFTIAQNAGQTIRYGNKTTTTGAGGSVTATAQGDSIRFICSVANTGFQVLSSVGNLTIV